MKNSIIIALCAMAPLSVCSQTRQPAKANVANVLRSLGITNVDTLRPGNTLYNIRGQRVSLRVSADGVEHIGIPVFPNELRTKSPSPVYDYIEYTLLVNTFHLPEASVLQGGVTFRKGAWSDMLAITSDMPCTVSCNDGKSYEVTWQRSDGSTLVAVSFPMQYDMLMFSNKEELEQRLIQKLKTVNGRQTDNTIRHAKAELFTRHYDNNEVYVLEGDTHIKQIITNNLYYRRSGSTYRLFSSSRLPAESLANILLTADRRLPKARILLSVVKYDATTEKVEITAADWLDCMKADGCRSYYAFDKEEDGKATVVLYAANETTGYDHVMTLTCNIDQLDSSAVSLQGTAYLFSPTSNVKNLFYEYKKK